MTHYDKIRAALELLEWRVLEAERNNQPIVATRRQLDEAIAALAELETAAQTPAPVAEIREPTPEECKRIHAFWLSAEGCNGRTPGERMGGLMFNAVRAVMWPKSEVS